jgi:hypothetical protein
MRIFLRPTQPTLSITVAVESSVVGPSTVAVSFTVVRSFIAARFTIARLCGSAAFIGNV